MRHHGGVGGRVILLSGPSSAGKSTLALALQARLHAPDDQWIVLSAEEYAAKVGLSADAADARIMQAFRAAVVGATRANVNVVVDDPMIEDDAWTRWQQNLRRVPLLRVDATDTSVDAVVALLDERKGGE